MSLIDKLTFEGRGARGCTDSHYSFGMTTCCERVGVLDAELHDFYFNPETPSVSVSRLAESACPLCGASRWNLYPLERLEQIPEHWRWACGTEPRPGSRRVLPLVEHVRELLAFCRRVAPPLPAWQTTLFLNTADPRVRNEGTWILPSDALATLARFSPAFDRLLVAGYSWMNLSAYGTFRSDLIVGVELPVAPSGTPPGLTRVNYSAPPPATDGRPRWDLDLVLEG